MNEESKGRQGVVIQKCDETSVFVNQDGSISVMQIDAYNGESSVVVIPVMHAHAVCRAIRAAAKEARGE